MSTKDKTLNINGEISIHTENIFPIIKKWLYSDHEIFLRELVSNGFDAITKLRHIVSQGNETTASEEKIEISIDKEKKTITISDTGLGLDAEEVEKYITQIAFSSAEEFVSKFKDDTSKNHIIGHFGLGFYSAFIVSEKVEIRSKSYKKEASSILWSCDGSTSYSIVEGDRESVGTDIILHINEESKEFLEEVRITSLVQKYVNFLPVTIIVNGKKTNDNSPLWIQSPSEVKEDDYKEFYKKVFPFQPDPLFWIHLNVDYPFHLQGILYFPKVVHELDANKGNIKLFCKQVFVSDNAHDIVPEFLTLLQGAIDCPEIPLNVSRSTLQNDPYVQKISKHIIKKVGDKLNELYANNKEHYTKIWPDISPFIKYGMMQNDAFYKRVKGSVLFESSTGDMTTVSDYLERNKEKTNKKVLYCTNKESQATYIDMCKQEGLEVIYLQGVIDVHFVQFLESRDSETTYSSVDSEVSDTLLDNSKTSTVVDSDNKTSDDRLKEIFKSSLNNEGLGIDTKSFKSDTISAMVVESEQSKRMKSMSHFMKGTSLPGIEDATLIINSNNTLIKDVQRLHDAGNNDALVTSLCEHVYDLARMSKEPLTGEAMQNFVRRSNELMAALSQQKVNS